MEHLQATIEYLEIKLREQMQDIEETKKIIDRLLRETGQAPRYQRFSNGAPVSTNEYYGRTPSQAAQALLARNCNPLSAAEIVKELEADGFDFESAKWPLSTRNRNMAISLSKNRHLFSKLPNKTWGLVTWNGTNSAEPSLDSSEVVEKRAEGRVKSRLDDDVSNIISFDE